MSVSANKKKLKPPRTRTSSGGGRGRKQNKSIADFLQPKKPLHGWHPGKENVPIEISDESESLADDAMGEDFDKVDNESWNELSAIQQQ